MVGSSYHVKFITGSMRIYEQRKQPTAKSEKESFFEVQSINRFGVLISFHFRV